MLNLLHTHLGSLLIYLSECRNRLKQCIKTIYDQDNKIEVNQCTCRQIEKHKKWITNIYFIGDCNNYM